MKEWYDGKQRQKDVIQALQFTAAPGTCRVDENKQVKIAETNGEALPKQVRQACCPVERSSLETPLSTSFQHQGFVCRHLFRQEDKRLSVLVRANVVLSRGLAFDFYDH